MKSFIVFSRGMVILMCLLSFEAIGQDSVHARIQYVIDSPIVIGLKFNDKTIAIDSFEQGIISPDGQTAAIVRVKEEELKNMVAKEELSTAIVSIYDKTYTLKRQFEVPYFDKILLTNTGRTVIYGFPGGYTSGNSYLYLYDENGVELTPGDYQFEFGHPGPFFRHAGYITDSGNYLTFLFNADALMTDPRNVVMLIFDKNLSLLGTRVFKDWGLYTPFWRPEVDEQHGRIKLKRYVGTSPDLEKETIYVNLRGKTVKTVKGW